MATHIRVGKKDDTLGIGAKAAKADNFMDQWWFAAYANSGAGSGQTIGGKAACELSDDSSDEEERLEAKAQRKLDRAAAKRSSTSGHKRKRAAAADSDSESDSDSSSAPSAAARKSSGTTMTIAGGIVIPSFEDLFKATGGARLGMRARREQPGKWKRAEAAIASKSAGLTDASAAAGSVSGKKASQRRAVVETVALSELEEEEGDDELAAAATKKERKAARAIKREAKAKKSKKRAATDSGESS